MEKRGVITDETPADSDPKSPVSRSGTKSAGDRPEDAADHPSSRAAESVRKSAAGKSGK